MGAQIPESFMAADKRAILIQPNLVVNANSQLSSFIFHRFALRVRGDMRGQDFDGDGALQPGVGGLIDLAHPPGPDGGLELIRAELGAAL